MKNTTTFLLLLISISAFSQKQEVMAKLKEYGIAEEFLNTSLKDHDATHSFDITTTTNDGKQNIVDKGYFDPLAPVGKRWILKITNNKEPSKKEIKKFNKAHNTQQLDINGEVDDASWKINRETENIIAIDFKYKKEGLPNKFAFLADCIGTAYINKKSGHLTLAEFKNDKPLKIKVFNVTRLEMTVDYLYLEEGKAYYMKKEHLDMDVKLLGQIVEVEEINEYSNYKKVK